MISLIGQPKETAETSIYCRLKPGHYLQDQSIARGTTSVIFLTKDLWFLFHILNYLIYLRKVFTLQEPSSLEKRRKSLSLCIW